MSMLDFQSVGIYTSNPIENPVFKYLNSPVLAIMAWLSLQSFNRPSLTIPQTWPILLFIAALHIGRSSREDMMRPSKESSSWKAPEECLASSERSVLGVWTLTTKRKGGEGDYKYYKKGAVNGFCWWEVNVKRSHAAWQGSWNASPTKYVLPRVASWGPWLSCSWCVINVIVAFRTRRVKAGVHLTQLPLWK